MTETSGPVEPRGRRETLALELRGLREAAGMSGREMARRLGVSQSKISRIESGALLPSQPEVTAWADAVDAPDQARQVLRELSAAVLAEIHTWRARRAGKPHLQKEAHERESRATKILNAQFLVVPGLLQTAAYARHLFSIGQIPYTPEGLAAAVAGRLDRQLILYGDKYFEFLIGESALHARFGPAQVLLAQLDRIASLATLDNLSIGVIPHRHPLPTLPVHGFEIHEGDQDQDALVTLEMFHGVQFVTEPADVQLYRTHWDLLRQAALFDESARQLLHQISAAIRDQTT